MGHIFANRFSTFLLNVLENTQQEEGISYQEQIQY